jgi:hypothetical protein
LGKDLYSGCREQKIMERIILILVFLFNSMFGLQWSRNDVLKFTPDLAKNFDNIMDFENIDIQQEFIQPAGNTNSWLVSYPIDIGKDYVVTEAFVNFQSSSTNSYVVLIIKDNENDEIIKGGVFHKSGKIDLINVFQKSVSIYIENIGTDIKIYSFGLVRKKDVIITDSDISILPEILFFEEDDLRIDFSLSFPSFLDVILFDKNGKIIDYAAQGQFFREGKNTLFWHPATSSSWNLISGTDQVYFKAKTADGKEVQLIKEFIFVKD